MNVSGLNVRITIQKSAVQKDKYQNHTSSWQDVFTCWATVVASGKSSGETHNAASTQEDDLLDITVRYCTETAAVNSKGYRILINGRIYNIISIDEMGFRKNSRKFHTERVER